MLEMVTTGVFVAVCDDEKRASPSRPVPFHGPFCAVDVPAVCGRVQMTSLVHCHVSLNSWLMSSNIFTLSSYTRLFRAMYQRSSSPTITPLVNLYQLDVRSWPGSKASFLNWPNSGVCWKGPSPTVVVER